MKIIFKLINQSCYILKTFLIKMRYGNSIRIDGVFRKRNDTQIILDDKSKIFIGNAVTFQRNNSLSSVFGGELHIGSRCHFNRNCIIICQKEIIIKDDVIFGPGVTIYDHDHIFSYHGILPGFKLGSVVIEKGCWIGANVTILRNTHIGECCVIGAGTIIKGDIPSHSIVTSNRELNIIPIDNRLI